MSGDNRFNVQAKTSESRDVIIAMNNSLILIPPYLALLNEMKEIADRPVIKVQLILVLSIQKQRINFINSNIYTNY